MGALLNPAPSLLRACGMESACSGAVIIQTAPEPLHLKPSKKVEVDLEPLSWRGSK